MPEELHLVTELSIILVAAGVFTILSKALKQPLILGYIVAGFLVGPHLGLFPQFSTEAVHEWSEIGIIFLLFGLGLEFSFKKLIKVGSSALLTAGVKCIGMMIVGLLAGNAMGWTFMESVFLGGLLSMSSTTIIIKAYDDMGLKKKPYASLIFGSLVVEDLIAVLLLVLLSTMAVSNQFAGGEMLLAIFKLVLYIVLSFVVGIYVIPTLFKKVRKFLSDEILLLVSIGLCFGMVVLANLAGFSSALGAFLMGSILSETFEGEKIEHITGSIKDLFGAIFFISVGMMVDPAVIAEHWLPILIITVVAMVGILFCSTTGALLAGQGLDTAVHAGFSLAQLGEFAFIIAGLGCSLGVMRDFIYPVIIAVSVITTFTTPYMIKAADPVSAWLYRKLPEKALNAITPKRGIASSSAAEKSEWKVLLKSLFIRIVVYSLLLIAILIASQFLDRFFDSLFPQLNPTAGNWIKMGIVLVVMFPFLYGLSVLNSESVNRSARKLLKEKSSNSWPIMSLMALRALLAMGFVLALVSRYFDLNVVSILLVFVAVAGTYFISRFSLHRMTSLETRFITNLNEKELSERKKMIVTAAVKEQLAGYDVHIETSVISADSPYVGRTLREMPFRHTTGVNIIKIKRGSKSIIVPNGDEYIYPGDTLVAVGTTEQLDAFRQSMAFTPVKNVEDELFVVEKITLKPDSYLVGKNLRVAKMRDSGCMVVSVMSSGVLTTNPKPDYVFYEGDIVWIAGAKSSVNWYK
ncbi:MAG: cation:proton antiporter [Bacteroidia bacterium]|nr:cation:proton antiporter [Bacteroidia bacterium]